MCGVCVQHICMCDGGGRHPVDSRHPRHAGSPAVLLHPGHQCISVSAHRKRLPPGCAMDPRQRTGINAFMLTLLTCRNLVAS